MDLAQAQADAIVCSVQNLHAYKLTQHGLHMLFASVRSMICHVSKQCISQYP